MREYKAQGNVLVITCFLGLLAEVCALRGRAQEGLDAIERALRMELELQEFIYHAELLRLKGDLLEIHGAGLDDVESCYRLAFKHAQANGAKWFELRAATSLAKLFREGSKREEATDILRSICAWFTEGRDTVDVTEARELLVSLKN